MRPHYYRKPRKSKTPTTPGTIYYISDGEHVKIGFTGADPYKRMKQLQTGHPKNLTLLAHHPGSKLTESQLHQRFSSARVRKNGEWFRLTPKLQNHIKDIPNKPSISSSMAEVMFLIIVIMAIVVFAMVL